MFEKFAEDVNRRYQEKLATEVSKILHFNYADQIPFVYSSIQKDINSKYNIDLGDIGLKISDMPETTKGKPLPDFQKGFGGCYVPGKGYIIINPTPEEAIRYYGGDGIADEAFMRKIIAHELGHAIYKRKDPIVNRLIEQAKREKFTTGYLDKEQYTGDKYDDELFAEYFSNMLNR